MSYRELVLAGTWRLLFGGIGLAVYIWAMLLGQMPDWPLWAKSFAGAGALILTCDGVRAMVMVSRKKKAEA